MQRPLLEPPKWYEYAPQFLSPARIDGGVAWWNAPRRRARARRGDVRRAGGGRRRDHRRRDVLRPQHRTASRARRARHARVRLSAPRVVLPRRAEALPAADARARRVAARRRKARSPARSACRNSCPAATATSPSTSTATAASICGSSDADIVGSVANYLARHDWQRGQPVLLPAAIADRQRATRCCAGSTAASASGARSTSGPATACPRATCPPISRPIRSACCCSKQRGDGRRRGELLDRLPQLLRA